MSGEFFLGIVVGVMIATFLGVIFTQIQKERSLTGAPNRPQGVGHQTAKTPWQVITAAIGAFFRIILWIIVLIAGLGMCAAIAIQVPG